MLWDLEGRFDDERRQLVLAEVDELADAERTGVTFAGRLLAMEGRAASITVRGGRVIAGTIAQAAQSWLLVRQPAVVVLVPISAISVISGLGSRTAPDPGIGQRIRITHFLRELAACEDHVVVDHDAGELSGTIHSVYADHFDVMTDTHGNAATRGPGAGAFTLSLAGIRCVVFPRVLR